MGRLLNAAVEATVLAVALAAVCLYPRDGLFPRLGVTLSHPVTAAVFVGLGTGFLIAKLMK